jgi:hypothetical protein
LSVVVAAERSATEASMDFIHDAKPANCSTRESSLALVASAAAARLSDILRSAAVGLLGARVYPTLLDQPSPAR